MVELEVAHDRQVSEENDEGVQHDYTTLDLQGIIWRGGGDGEREEEEEEEEEGDDATSNKTPLTQECKEASKKSSFVSETQLQHNLEEEEEEEGEEESHSVTHSPGILLG